MPDFSAQDLPFARDASINEVAQGEDLPGWDLKFLQLTSGQVRGQTRIVDLDGMQLVRERYEGVVLNEYGALPPDSFVFGIPISMEGPGYFNGGHWHDGICMTRSEHEFDTVIPPADMLSVVVNKHRFVDHFRDSEQIDLTDWLSRRSLIVNQPALTLATAIGINDVASACASGDVDLADRRANNLAVSRVLDCLTPVILSQLEVPPLAYREMSRPYIVRKARDYVLAHIEEPLQVIDICRATGVSRRALQISFQDVLGVTPLSYLRLIRLNGARQALLHPQGDTQVKSVVAQYGFWHQSRFSNEYRACFGELPSETLRRRRS